jgi:hypothetical protein
MAQVTPAPGEARAPPGRGVASDAGLAGSCEDAF